MFDDPKPDETVCMKVKEFNDLIRTSLNSAISRLLDRDFVVESFEGVRIEHDPLELHEVYHVKEPGKAEQHFCDKEKAIELFLKLSVEKEEEE